jgi:tRNA (guanine10-N2)-dimethyltransferase
MRYYFELSKEYPNIPRLEVIATLQSLSYDFKIIYQNDDIIIVEFDNKYDIKKIASRISLVYSISEYLFSVKPDNKEIKKEVENNPIIKKGTIAVRCKNRSNEIKSTDLLRAITQVYTKDKIVNLTKPDIEIYVLITDDLIHVGILKEQINRKQFEQRKAQYRPFFSPISLHPKIARCLVNLAKVRENDSVYDPFCGTGGFLIEAGLIGCKLFGSDIEKKMVNGTKQNLEFYHISYDTIFTADIGKIKDCIKSPVDAVITDFPYGKATTTNKEELCDLYHRAFNSIYSILKSDGKIIIGLPSESYIEIIKNKYHIEIVIKIPVHRSLTRYFYVGTKKLP